MSKTIDYNKGFSLILTNTTENHVKNKKKTKKSKIKLRMLVSKLSRLIKRLEIIMR